MFGDAIGFLWGAGWAIGTLALPLALSLWRARQALKLRTQQLRNVQAMLLARATSDGEALELLANDSP